MKNAFTYDVTVEGVEFAYSVSRAEALAVQAELMDNGFQAVLSISDNSPIF